MSNFKLTTIFKLVEILILVIIIDCQLFTDFQIKPIPSILEAGIYHAFIPIFFGLILNDLNDGDLGLINIMIVYVIAIVGFEFVGVVDILFGTGQIKFATFYGHINKHLISKGAIAMILGVICLIDLILQLFGIGDGDGE